ncbi:phospholipid transporting ATPase [Coemansia sp. RSA 552]|nr:phospholipid transporting ATPase [Coemansia sp. RSA 552]
MSYQRINVGVEPLGCIDDADSFARSDMVRDGADFAVVPIAQSLQGVQARGFFVPDDLVVKTPDSAYCLLGKPGEWADNAATRGELEYAAYIGLKGVVAPAVASDCAVADYARLLYAQLEARPELAVYVRVHMSMWDRWNRIRMLCNHSPRLRVLLELEDSDADSLVWRAEPVRIVALPVQAFRRNTGGFPVLSRSLQGAIRSWMDLGAAFAVQGEADLGDYVRYLRHLADSQPERSLDHAASDGYRDVLQAPLQPLMDHLESVTYETFEADEPKYAHYEDAMARAIADMGKRLARPIVLIVVGAGRGPLVSRALHAARRCDADVRVVALEKNPGAMAELHWKNAELWQGKVDLVHADMRRWSPPSRADILVSELLGSFGDNELSPECLDGALSHIAADDCVCIPRRYTAYVAPLSSTVLFQRAREQGGAHSLETPYVVNIHAARILAAEQETWSFRHDAQQCVSPPDNQRTAACEFAVDAPAMIHGFAGYFDAELYPGVQLSICPATHTPDMHSWFPMYFPVQRPLAASAGSHVVVRLWRRTNGAKTWYEWCVDRLFSRRRNADGAGAARTVYVNTPMPPAALDARGRPPAYAPNHIRTAKYTALSFVPKNLLEQFRRAANVYFLFLLILQFIPAVATGMPGLSALALFTIVALTMLKDGYEDSKRSASDREANRTPAVVLGRRWANFNKAPAHALSPRGPARVLSSDLGGQGSVGAATPGATWPHSDIEPRLDSDIGIDSDEWMKTEWRHVCVGDIVLLRDGDPVPADMLLLASDDADGVCFVETKNLDGETNLKSKHAPLSTLHLTSPQRLAAFQCAIEAEPPNTQLYSFKGTIEIPAAEPPAVLGGSKDPLNVDNLLLRGSVVRNTKWSVGVAVFTGDDTKVMQNSGETPSKRSYIERMMNYQVMSQFCMLFVLCLLTAILGGVYYARPDSFQALFIVLFESSSASSAPLYGFRMFWTSLILYQTVVPISLYVTIEIVKLFQVYFISQDADMYYEPANLRCKPLSWNLSDDLGQVEYIFSDKTGTLTQNVMVFRQCSIGGKVYGEIVPEDDTARTDELRHGMSTRMELMFRNPFRQSETSTFFDAAMYDDLGTTGKQSRTIFEFFTVLAVCHTVMSDRPDPSQPHKIEYKAQSPDEAALVSTARDVGFVFLRRDKDRILCNFCGQDVSFQLLATLEFTSARKRMSAIVRSEDGRIMLLTKGADSVIMERIRDNQERLRQATLEDLELFASHGLRTLCLGYRTLEEDEYIAWRRDYDRAMSSLDDRDAEVEEVCDRIERGLQLIGGTAIEDKLQDGVPATIAQLALAGIKLWVLTGDKTETAINIGFSCNLLNPDMNLITVKGGDENSTREQLEHALRLFGDTHGDLSYKGGGGGPMSGIPKKGPGSWRRLVRRIQGEQTSINPAFQHARDIAQNKNHRHGVKGVWDDIRTRNVPAQPSGLQLKYDAPMALVIDGDSLKYALEPELAPLLLELAVRCQSVLCCRVSPLQKALVVRLVKEGLGTLCLAIGDGANDVSMIQEADVGVGISGEEGVQAVMVSDYAIAQFRFLQKLLLVHGRWSYLRITSMILNFFYKNVVFTIALFWFQIYCQWSVANVFDYTLITLYNMLFTSLPPGALGVLDQDLPGFVGAVVPQLYKRGIYKLEYSMARFWTYIFDGIYQSAVITFLVVYTYHFSFAAKPNGLDSASGDDIGTVGAFCVILTTNLYMAMNNRTWTWVMPIALVIGLALLLGVFFVYGVIYDTEFSSGAGVRIFAQANFWLLLVLTAVACLLPHFIVKFVRSAWYPTDTDIVREIVHRFRKGKHASKSRSHPSLGVLDRATNNPHKEVPFGAIPEHRPAAPGAYHDMEGAIPLNDIAGYLSTPTSTRVGNHTPQQHKDQSAGDPLNRPGLYQGIEYPERDAALVGYLHGLAHGEEHPGPGSNGPGGSSILRRLSVRQQHRQRQAGVDPVGSPVLLNDEGQDMSHLRRMASRASARSSIYHLDSGSLEPYTGFAFAQEEQRPGQSRRKSSRQWRRGL